jgi:hypothetical protein
MQKEPVAAEAASQPNADALSAACPNCNHALARTAHLCAACGAPQSVRPDLTPFDLIGIEMQFGTPELDLTVRRQLMALTRDLHPDRFVQATQAGFKITALQRMSAVTKAARDVYAVDDRRASILSHFNIRPEPGQEALEWGERWFEQDENPEQVALIHRDLEARLAELNGARSQLESEWDRTHEVTLLQQIANQTGLIQTLKSLRQNMQASAAIPRSGT